MTDFLTRLIERSSGRASVVQPVIAPVFAPGLVIASNSSPDLLWEEMSPEVPGATQVALAGQAPRAASSADLMPTPPAAEEVLSAGMPSEARGDRPVDNATRPLMAKGSDERDALQRPAGDRHGGESPRSKMPAESAEELASLEHGQEMLRSRGGRRDARVALGRAAGPSGGMESPRSRHATRGAPSQAEPLAVSRGSEHVRAASRAESSTSLEIGARKRAADAAPLGAAELAESAVQPAGTLVRRSLASSAIRSQVVPQIERREPMALDLRRAAPESSALAPTVRVTIGRVEIRAITSSAPPARAPAAPRSPSLSLDEYLEQRSAGRP